MSDTIKNYSSIQNQYSLKDFGISRMEDIYEKRKGVADDPHRHDYYTILLVKRGSGKHFIDFNEYALSNNQVFFVSPGQVHQVVESSKTYGFSIRS